jgi:hypothetical protein
MGDVMIQERTLQAENPAEALRNENGIFKVISPYGHVFRVTCRKGANMRIREVGMAEDRSAAEPRAWRIERISSPKSEDLPA